MTSLEKIRNLRGGAPTILPSLLLCDFGNLEREVARLRAAGIQALHLDVMDGNFVPNLTYGMPIVEGLRRLTDMPLDVHLMIARPERYVDAFCDAGADAVTVHIEAVEDPVSVLRKIRSRDVAAGITLNPDTPMEALVPVEGECDLVLVMSVNAGFGGQSFDSRAIERLQRARLMFGGDVILEVDGGVNTNTIGSCHQAGAEFLVVGSAIFKAHDYQTAVSDLSALATSP